MTTRLTAKIAGLSLIAGVSMFATATAAAADQGAAPTAPQIEYGKSLLCLTPEKAEQLVASFGSDMGAALKQVNAGAQVPFCQAVPVAFVRGQMLGTLRSKDATFQMVEVLVVGIGGPEELRAVAPAALISLVRIQELAV